MIRNKNATALVRRTVFYGLAGTCGVSIDAGVFYIVSRQPLNQNLEILNIFTYALGSAVSFSINSRLTFRSPSQRLSARRFFLICILGMILSTSILHLLISSGFNSMHSKAVGTIFTVFAQYITNTLFQLSRKKGVERSAF